MKKAQKSGFGIVGIIIIIAAVAVLGGGYWYWQSRTEVPLPSSSDQSPVIAEGDFTEWKTYRNEQYGFEVRYPPNFSEWKGEPQNSTIIGNYEQDEYIFIQIPGDEGNAGKNCEDYTLAGQKFQRCEIKVEVGGFMTDDGILNWTEKSILVRGIHQGQLLIIRFQAKEDRTDLFQTFETILSSFKFIK